MIEWPSSSPKYYNSDPDRPTNLPIDRGGKQFKQYYYRLGSNLANQPLHCDVPRTFLKKKNKSQTSSPLDL